MTQMEKINKIWKDRTGADLTTEEAWKMAEFIKAVLEQADKALDKETK